MMLADAPMGVALTVLSVTNEEAPRRQLVAHGVWPGASIEVFHRAAFGGRVIRLGTDRLALDARACARIEVDAVA